jgi:hypothetical protein
MDIVITQWALDSYLDLKHYNTISDIDYKTVIRPDVMLLKTYPAGPKFQNSKFWSIATFAESPIPNGYKMKWHNLGNGKVQLRLPVAMGVTADAVLCEAYVKGNAKEEQRKLARFKTHLQLIRLGRFTECGRL